MARKVRVRKKRRSSQIPLYLKRITIRNIRCFEKIGIGLAYEGKPRKWGVILGDNGVGKTTLLRCIAMGLCDASSAGGLLGEIYGEWNRKSHGKSQNGEILIEFIPPRGGEKRQIRTRFFTDPSGYTRIEQKTQPKNFPWGRIFVCGYGAARRAFSTKDYDEYAAIDAVYSLFNYDISLQNPELVLWRINRLTRRIRSEADYERYRDKTKGFLDSIASILMLEPGAVALTKSGLSMKGPWGDFQSVGGLADGYQATLAWIADLLGWAYLYNDGRPLTRISGIVIIDEIEQHLHPRWQRKIIGLLRRQFPYIQFIATTHTPMCAIGTTELDDSECELIVLERHELEVRAVENFKPPRGQWADQVLTSRLFKLPTAGDEGLLEATSRYNQLMSKERETMSPGERREAAQIHAMLSNVLRAPKSEFEGLIEEAVMDALKAQANKAISRAAARFEVRRQMRALRSK
jgi:energy-coupling factor transporter ATP-binding protein EcfA2